MNNAEINHLFDGLLCVIGKRGSDYLDYSDDCPADNLAIRTIIQSWNN